jgi:hypothetical protein
MTDSSSREEDFTTIRITKRDRDLLEDIRLPKESAWETFRRVLHAAKVSQIKKKDDKPAKMSRKSKRIVGNIEACFSAYLVRGQQQISFVQIKDWINENTKDGISSPRLSNLLRRRPQFHLVRKERRKGTNEIQCYWAVRKLDGSIPESGDISPGWVEVPLEITK